MIPYDYIIAGGGLSGLSLALKILSSSLQEKKILIIDADLKDKNDRTWSYWSKEDFFPDLEKSSWNTFEVLYEGKNLTKSFYPYTYYSIRGDHFYQYALSKINQAANIDWHHGEITSVNTQEGFVETTDKTFQGNLIFSSFFTAQDIPHPKGYSFLLQHFKGWMIETTEDTFDDQKVRLMDFNTDQSGDTKFFYILPFSKRKALIEYTVFSPEMYKKQIYDDYLKEYIQTTLKIDSYTIIEEEFNAIPMTDFPFSPKRKGKTIPIGTLAGYVKPSSGYCFVRTQERITKIVTDLEKGEIPKTYQSTLKYKVYDSILLWTMEKRLAAMSKIFPKLYGRLNNNLVFKFLNEETSLWEDIQIIIQCPPIFIWSFFTRLLKINKIK